MKKPGTATRTERENEPKLKRVLAEATRALAQLDAARLEEMARSCEALVLDGRIDEGELRDRVELESRDAAREMAMFLRVLEATKANLSVVRRLREVPTAPLQYGHSGMGDYGDH